jgi:hypothetical protein
MAGETLHSDFTKTFDFRYTNLQWFVVGMEDPSSEGKMVVLPPPSNKRMRQHDEVCPLFSATIFSPILLGLDITRFWGLGGLMSIYGRFRFHYRTFRFALR